MPVKQLRRVRWAVRATLGLGVAASVVANVLHAMDNPISQAIAAWPPLALLLTVELISRVPVHRRSLAFTRICATAVIAGIAAWVSYWHMAGVAARYGETGASAYLLPLSVDGLIVVASICLVELGARINADTTSEATPANARVAGHMTPAGAETAGYAAPAGAGTVFEAAPTNAGSASYATSVGSHGPYHAAAGGRASASRPVRAAAGHGRSGAAAETASSATAVRALSTVGAAIGAPSAPGGAKPATAGSGPAGSRPASSGPTAGSGPASPRPASSGPAASSRPTSSGPAGRRGGTGRGAGAGAKSRSPRRPVAETAALAAAYEAARPDATEADVARALGITTRRLRDVRRQSSGQATGQAAELEPAA